MKNLLISLSAAALLAACADPRPEAESPTSAAHGATEEAVYATVTDESLDQFLAEADVAVLEFWATWCGPCKIMGPRFEAVAGDMASQASFGKVDVDDNGQTASKYGVRSIPTVLVIKDSEVVETLVGVRPQDELQAAVARHVN